MLALWIINQVNWDMTFLGRDQRTSWGPLGKQTLDLVLV